MTVGIRADTRTIQDLAPQGVDPVNFPKFFYVRVQATAEAMGPMFSQLIFTNIRHFKPAEHPTIERIHLSRYYARTEP